MRDDTKAQFERARQALATMILRDEPGDEEAARVEVEALMRLADRDRNEVAAELFRESRLFVTAGGE